MDLSAFIFVALAVAWAVYLVPKALKHHDDVVRSRSVDRFSHTMRVLARREPAGSLGARLVVTPARGGASTAPSTATSRSRTSDEFTVEVSPATPEQARRNREAANRAARRRRKVLGALVLANVAVLVGAAFSLLAWPYTAIPGGLLVAWLVACRLMVRRERTAWAPSARMPIQAEEEDEEPLADPETLAEVDDLEDTSTMAAAVAPGALDPTLWDPVPVTLPTYVTKPAATRRTVRTIALDDSGVWTSGNTAADSQLAREAEVADKAARSSREQGDDQRAVGS